MSVSLFGLISSGLLNKSEKYSLGTLLLHSRNSYLYLDKMIREGVVQIFPSYNFTLFFSDTADLVFWGLCDRLQDFLFLWWKKTYVHSILFNSIFSKLRSKSISCMYAQLSHAFDIKPLRHSDYRWIHLLNSFKNAFLYRWSRLFVFL